VPNFDPFQENELLEESHLNDSEISTFYFGSKTTCLDERRRPTVFGQREKSERPKLEQTAASMFIYWANSRRAMLK